MKHSASYNRAKSQTIDVTIYKDLLGKSHNRVPELSPNLVQGMDAFSTTETDLGCVAARFETMSSRNDSFVRIPCGRGEANPWCTSIELNGIDYYTREAELA